MAKTRKRKVRGLVTPERLDELQPGMILRMHIPNAADDHWDWFDIRYIGHTADQIIAAERLDDVVGSRFAMSSLGILPYRSGKVAVSFTTVRDVELGLGPVL